MTNAATIIGDGNTVGIELLDGGALTNGSAVNSIALVEGYDGFLSEGAGISTNFGTIIGLGAAGDAGAVLAGGASLNNGAANATHGLIEGYDGVIASGTAILTNFGTVKGDAGVAVSFTSSGDTLAVGAGSVFIGSINGGGGTLELVNGSGTLTGLLAGGSVTVSGSMASTTFANFATAQIDAGASFSLAGTGGTIAAGQTLNLFGTLSGTGSFNLTAGTANIGTGASLTIAKVSQSGGTASFTASTLTVSDVWTQTAGIVTVATGDRVNFSGTGNSFSGTFAGAGTVGFTGGTDALTGTTLSATLMVITFGASVDSPRGRSGPHQDPGRHLPEALRPSPPPERRSAAMRILNLNATTSTVIGATAATTLTNTSDRIIGEGQLGDGQLKIVNGGTIDGSLTGALIYFKHRHHRHQHRPDREHQHRGTTITGAVNSWDPHCD